MGFSYNTWGSSWKTSWANSWGGGVTPPVIVTDTHDSVRKRHKPAQIIYETRAPELKEWAKQEEQIEAISPILGEEKPVNIPAFVEWDLKQIEAHAKATSQSIEQVERKLALLQAYEKELDEEEIDFMQMIASIH